jgi:beta-glucanase (GH16 family)
MAMAAALLAALAGGAAGQPADLLLAAPPPGPAPAACSPVVAAPAGPPLALRQTFADDFDAFDPYAGPWTPHFDHNAYGDWRARTLAANGEAQIYVDPRYRGGGDAALGLDPFRLGGGRLALVAAPAPDALRPTLHGFAFTSGLVSSRRSFLQRHGYFEIRARLPSAPGAWAAFWLLSPGRWPPEIDVMEARGGEEAVHVHAHWHADGRHRASGCRLALPHAGDGLHSFGLLWQPDALTFYLDRRPAAWIAGKPGLDRPMYLLANLAVGGWGGTPDPARYPAAFEIDRIAAYRLEAVRP